MSTHLDRIIAQTRTDLAQRKATASRADLERAASAHTPRGFACALRQRALSGPAIIAELKKASPSKGMIREDFDVRILAPQLEANGAAALSILTDAPFFQGSLENLRQASAATSLPCLRKDFIVDEFQILEARAHQADAILLIAAALSDAELKVFRKAALDLSLDVLCEVHSAEEAQRVADLGCEAIGVNNRDLRTFQVSLETSISLCDELPADTVLVAESGIHTTDDLLRLRHAGFHAFLVGESLMRQPHPGQALADLLAPVHAPAMATGRA
jgi:indole-3-glycerol phosphate synthase